MFRTKIITQFLLFFIDQYDYYILILFLVYNLIYVFTSCIIYAGSLELTNQN